MTVTIDDDEQAIGDPGHDPSGAGEAGETGHAAVRDDASAEEAGGVPSDRGDHIVVLGWWQRPMNLVTLLVTTALVAGMIGWLVHDTVSETDASDVDVGFLWDMRIHHEQAVQMGFIYLDLPDADPRLRDIAAEIVMGQSLEIGRMVQLLRGFGEEEARDLEEPTMGWMGMSSAPGSQPGMATDQEIDELMRAEGSEADELFVDLMSTHHWGGIDMAQFAAEHGDDDQVVRMAEAMAGAQESEIVQMRRILGTE